MPTINQLILSVRKTKKRKTRTAALNRCPQRKGICRKVTEVSPKKPNSARRKIAVIGVSQKIWLGERPRKVLCYRPGEGNNLAMFSAVLIRGGRVKDIPGMRYKIICNKYGAPAIHKRRQARSKYGVKLLRDAI